MRGKSRHSNRYVTVSAIAVAVAAFFIIAVFYQLYQVSKRNILTVWQNNTEKTASDLGYYLTMPTDAVSFSAVKINEMRAKGASHKEVGEYLVNETAIYSMIINENNTGVYSYYDGEYLDGSGWTPPDDYDPTRRPWYTAAVAANGRITMVKPFRNLQTDTVMMSVSQLLDDGESVVSMDIFLDGVQDIVEKLSRDAAVDSALVIDHDGFVVAHSDKQDVAKDYSKEKDVFKKSLYKNLKRHKNNNYFCEENGKNRRVFVQQINQQWYVVLVLSESEILSPLIGIFFAVAAALLVVIGTILATYMHVSRKHRESVQLSKEVMAIADIYSNVVQIDLKSDEMSVIRGGKAFEKVLDGDYSGFSRRVNDLAAKLSSERSMELTLKFMEASTLGERLSKVNSISQELMDYKGRWIRLRFIVVDRDEEGELSHVLWAVESIDEDRKQQEYLKKISETDLMTGVKNRGCGEALIRQKIAEGRKGLFCLLDADDFKSVNDTFGHRVGDEVIIMIANSLTQSFRESDIVFRLGGDEFAVFAEGITDRENAMKAIDRFFSIMGESHPEALGDRRITVSIGASFYRDTQFDTFEDLYQRADIGTYESKRFGGNHVSFNEE